jgi:hypothetical protein
MGGVFLDGIQNALVLRQKKGVPSSVTNRKPWVEYQSVGHRGAPPAIIASGLYRLDLIKFPSENTDFRLRWFRIYSIKAA